jgi:hypothetical protein
MLYIPEGINIQEYLFFATDVLGFAIAMTTPVV